ncbi:hypothetical protein [Chitinophaga sp. 212800010-3]|uniref:hypothetical protein n=1 Tax=unclassified Chitinophaga TaxID=2619133 RepID=UPI002DEDD12F|nr:Exported protein [Chitinophaga sp. 212800010-3]
MKKIAALFALVAVNTVCFAQEETEWKDASKESQAYHEYRLKLSRPPDGLAKVTALLEKTPVADDGQNVLPQKEYMALSLREKFTYHMIHAESYSQNCDARPPIQDEQKKIFAELPDAFGEANWSQRQRNFLSSNRDSVIALLSASIARSSRVGVNYKLAISETNGRELIPLLISTYKKERKDHDILTLLMLLMVKGEYAPFMSSPSYKKLYTSEQSSYDAYLNYNQANEDLIIQRATAYYDGLPKKG